MIKTVAIIISPNTPIRGATLNIPKILSTLGLNCLLITTLKNNNIENLPENVIFYNIFLSTILKNIVPKVPRLIGNVIEQCLIMLTLIILINRTDIFLFSHLVMPIPIICLKLLKKKTMVLIGGISYFSIPKNEKYTRKLIFYSESIQCKFCDVILIISDNLRNILPFSNYKNKIFKIQLILFDDDFFKKFYFSKLIDRKNMIGFIGRFSWEKGVIEFINSIPLIVSKIDDAQFLIIGDGLLKSTVTNLLKSYGLDKHVNILPWVNNVENYLHALKLLVIPSYSEGIPSIMFEAMASGTPVLATSVGGISEILKNESTGFLLKSNDPEYLADKITYLLDSSQLLESVNKNAYLYLKKNFSFEKTLEDWRKAIFTG